MNPRPLLHLEGAGVFFLSIVAYHWNHGSWGLFVLFFFVPDVSMVGYFANARIGALVYNAVHSYIGPLFLGTYGIATENRTALLLALVWVAHIGMDRALGFGLKYPTEFKRHAFERTPTRVPSQVESATSTGTSTCAPFNRDCFRGS